MFVDFNSTISALADSFVDELFSSDSVNHPKARKYVTRFLIEQHMRMPDYLRFPLKLLTLVFDTWPLPHYMQSFHQLSHQQRWMQIESWKHSKFKFRRDFIRFFESLIVFAWYSQGNKREP